MTPNQSKSFSSTDRTETRGLHAAIMSLPCVVVGGEETSSDVEYAWVAGFKQGHKTARHAAAELALESDAINAELLEALQGLLLCMDEPADSALGMAKEQERVEAARAALKKATA